MTAPRVALVGANGHGLWHRRRLAPMHAGGAIDLVALCDTAPVAAADDAPIPGTTKVYADHAAMLADASPEVVVICTPPHTHLSIATDAVHAGCDLLLEKPPVPNLAEHRALAEALAETGRACQVGFQALGSAALAELVAAIRAGRLGQVTSIAVAGSWQRPDSYYRRSPWAGRRMLDGRPVLDGALANPFAHAVMQALAIAAAAGAERVDSVEVQRYRTRDIETDDTSCLRVKLGDVTILVAVTLCGEEFIAGDIVVRGSEGAAELQYPTDRLRLPGDAGQREMPGRVGLLENLLEHRATGAELLVPLARTETFTEVLEAMTTGPAPVRIEPQHLVAAGDGQHAITGINAAIGRATTELSLFSEVRPGWTG